LLLDTVPNPCLAASTEQEQYYPFAFSAQAFVQCNGDILYVRPCASGLYWNQEAKICDRAETSPAPPPAQDQSQSYQVTYSNEQPTAYARPTASFADQTIVRPQTAYAAPTASLADQTIVRPQTYQQQAWQPQTIVNDQR